MSSISLEDFITGFVPAGGKEVPQERKKVKESSSSIPLPWKDPIGPDNFLMNTAADPITLAHGTLNNFLGADIRNSTGGGYDPNTGEFSKLNSGSKVADALDGLGRVFQAGSGAEGVLGGFGAPIAQALGDLPAVDSAFGTFGGLKTPPKTPGARWFKDIDGHMKYEISDAAGGMTEKALDNMRYTMDEGARGVERSVIEQGKLRDFYVNDDLERIAPEIFDYNTVMSYLPRKPGVHEKSGSFTPAWAPDTDFPDKITPARFNLRASSPRSFLDLVAHETEHGMQDLNGFPGGGSPNNILYDIKDTVEGHMFDKIKEVLAALKQEPTLAKMPVKDSGPLSGWTEAGGDTKTLYETLANPRPSKNEMKTFINWFDNRPENFKKEITPLVKPWLEHFVGMAPFPQPGQEYDIYYALLGEQNARAAALRRTMTDEQRAAKTLAQTRAEDPENLNNPLSGSIFQFNPMKPLKDQLR